MRASRRGGARRSVPDAEAPLRGAPQEVKASLLVTAAEMKREKPQEDEATKQAREEQEILRSVMVRTRARACRARRS